MIEVVILIRSGRQPRRTLHAESGISVDRRPLAHPSRTPFWIEEGRFVRSLFKST